MSGVAGLVTLYDAAGNAVQVKLVDGQYRLVVVDETVARSLDTIALTLAAILEELREQRGGQ